MVVMEECVSVLADGLLVGVAEHSAGGRIDEGDAAFEVDAVQAVGRRLQDAGGSGLGFGQGVGALLDKFFEMQAVLLKFCLDPAPVGNVAGAANGADDLAFGVDERCLVNFQTEEFPPDVSIFDEDGGFAPFKRDGIAVLAKFAEGVPVRTVRMILAFAPGEEQIGLAQRFADVNGVEQVDADRLVGKQVVFVEILGPDHVRHVVAHQAQHRRQMPRTLFVGVRAFLGQLAFGNVMTDAEHADQTTVAVVHRRFCRFEKLGVAVIGEGDPLLVAAGVAAGNCLAILLTEKVCSLLVDKIIIGSPDDLVFRCAEVVFETFVACQETAVFILDPDEIRHRLHQCAQQRRRILRIRGRRGLD